MASQITRQIWIGDSSDARNAPEEIDALLNCAHDLANYKQWDSHHLAQCGLIDGPGNSPSAYYSAVMQLNHLIQLRKRILVHCHKGESRSVAVCIMYLNVFDEKGWDHWMDFIRERRAIPPGNPHMVHRQAFEATNWRYLRGLL